MHAAKGDHGLEVYRFFRDEVGAEFMQFIPIVERATPELLPIANQGGGDTHLPRPLYQLEGELVTDRSVTADQWGRFLISVFDEWVRRDVGKVFIQVFDAALGSWYGIGSSLRIFKETCGEALAIEHNGDLYSCDHFVEPKHLLGNIQKDHLIELIGSEQQRKFGNDKRDTLPRYCRECEVRFACNGECPRNRFIRTPDGEPGLNYLCAGYKAFFNHIDHPMRLMADLLKQNRYADEVMGLLAREVHWGRAQQAQAVLVVQGAKARVVDELSAGVRRITAAGLGEVFFDYIGQSSEIPLDLPDALGDALRREEVVHALFTYASGEDLRQPEERQRGLHEAGRPR